jgi:hypothetical protein
METELGDFEHVDDTGVSYCSQLMDLLHSCVLSHMRASWLYISIRQLIAELPQPQPLLIEQGLTGLMDITDILCDIRSHKLVILPVILQGAIPHMTVVIVDTVQRRIVYYNPSGLTPLHETRPIYNASRHIGVLQLLFLIAKQTQCEILYSPLREQRWGLSCGSYCLAFIERAVMFPELLTLLPLSIKLNGESML